MNWIRSPRPNPTALLRLFCFPYAGGMPAYESWIDHFPPQVRRSIEVCSIDLPGRASNRREPLFLELSSLLVVLEPMIASYSDLPYAFFGHSMGALLSFELARHLRRRKLPGPVHLTLCGHRAPQLGDPHEAIHKMPDHEFRAKLREFGGTSEAVLQNAELIELLTPVLRADFAVCENYSYLTEMPLDCSITAFGGEDDPRVSRAELSAWRDQTTRSFSLRMFPGGHFFMQQSAVSLFVRVLAQDLKDVLKRAAFAS
jgi:medium-chain acyl-[acyl-carrier-protein] hydrolase